MAKTFKYDYQMFCEGIDSIAKQIKKSDVKFKYIVGVARGGVIPAVHLSHKLDLPLHVVHWSQFERNRKLAFDNDEDDRIAEDLEHGINILLVDDIIDQGSTIRELKKHWTNVRFFQQLALSRLKVATLIYRRDNKSKVKADFFHMEHPGPFIDFWWEK